MTRAAHFWRSRRPPGRPRRPAQPASTASCIVALRDGPATAQRHSAARVRTPRYAAGDLLPRRRYQRLLNSGYHGLPPVADGWRYFEVEGRVLRVRPDTIEIIGDATAETNRAF